jgi:flagellar hook-length control protein FliK
MGALMIPLVQTSKATAAVEGKSPVGRQPMVNFSGYLEKKMATERQDNTDLLGLSKGKGASAPAPAADRNGSAVVSGHKEGGDEATAISTLLEEFVQHLQKSAGDQKQGPGEWLFPVPDPELLRNIAKDAGMNESQLAMLLEKMKTPDGRISLVDFLGSFSRHFATLQDEIPVTAPETDLPLLQIFLERIGVPVSEVSRISEAAVRGDNTLDLEKFLTGLQGLSGEGITDLSPLEAEQLQDILAGAGGSRQLQRALFPERLPVVEGLLESGPPLTLTLDRLRNMLEQTIGEVQANRLQADPLAFLSDLQEMLSRSGFETKGPSLSSAVQGALVSVFEKLMESVDLAKVKVQKGPALAEAARGEKGVEHWQEMPEAGTVLAGEAQTETSHAAGRGKPAAGASAPESGSSGELFAEHNSFLQGDGAAAARGESIGPAAVSNQAARPFVHIANLPPGLQQQSFAQLSQGVLQGLRNQEHHLLLTLYPKELGEVKVEMTVRDNQVAVSFVMENSRVKEVLESNLEQFRENMEKQGFALGECMVSLDRDPDGNETWQQLQAATLEKGAGRRRTTLADLPEDSLYQRVQPGNGRESGVDLFA